MTEKLKVINDFKKTILYLDKIIINFPGNERVLKDKISNSMYEVLECMYMANEVSNYNRILYQKKIVRKVSLDKKYISYKKYQKVCGHLLDNLKLIYGWIRYEKI